MTLGRAITSTVSLILSASHDALAHYLELITSRRVRGLHAPNALVTAAFACYPDLEKRQQAMEFETEKWNALIF